MQFAICNFLPALILSALCTFLFFYRLGGRDLWSSHEARAAQDAQTILAEGCWGLPHLFDGRPELQKPPLYYWLVASFVRLRGGQVDAWAVRLPASASGLLCVLGLYGVGVWRRRPVMGFVAAAVLATAEHFTWMARIGRIDMPLCLAVGLAVAAVYLRLRHEQEQKAGTGWAWLLAAYAAVAAAVMLKGPIGIILVAAVLGCHLLVEGELPRPWRLRGWLGLARRLGLWWGIPLVLVLTVPWFWWANVRTGGELFRSFFLYHNVERAFGGHGGLRAHPWWFYAPRLAVDLLPWSPLLVAGAWFLKRRQWQGDPELRLGLVWCLAVVVVLSCARFKRADYLLPAYPGAALFIGCTLERWYGRSAFPGRLRFLFLLVLLGCAAGWWVVLDRVLPAHEPERDQRPFAAEIRRRAPAGQPVLFFRTEAHALAFHVGQPACRSGGRPVETFVEWEKLDAFAGRPDSYYVVMPPDSAAEWPKHLHSGRLEVVLANCESGGRRPEHPLMLLRTRTLH